MALLAAIQKFKTDKKVLVMSFKNDYPGSNFEDFMEEDTTTDAYGSSIGILRESSYTDDGIDALLRRAESGMLKKDNFDHCVTPLQKIYHGLDILHTTKEPGFEKTLAGRWSHIEKIMNIAESIYDYVFVYAGIDNEAFIDKMNEMSAKIVMVVRQGKKVAEPACNAKVHAKTAVLITDYEAESTWDRNKIKKMYNSNNVFTFPHNVNFGDAKELGKTLWFAATNLNPEKQDSNYELITEVKKLLSWLDNSAPVNDIHMADDPRYTNFNHTDRVQTLEHHPTEVHQEHFETKGSFFKKKESFVSNVYIGGGGRPASATVQKKVPKPATHYHNDTKQDITDNEDANFNSDNGTSAGIEIEDVDAYESTGYSEDIHDNNSSDSQYEDTPETDGMPETTASDDLDDDIQNSSGSSNLDTSWMDSFDSDYEDEPEPEPEIKPFNTDMMFETLSSKY